MVVVVLVVRTTTKTNNVAIIIINPPNTDNDDDVNFERLHDIGIRIIVIFILINKSAYEGKAKRKEQEDRLII